MTAEIMLRTLSAFCVWFSYSVSVQEQGGTLCCIQYKFSAGKMVDTWLCDFPFNYEWISIYFKTHALPSVGFLLYWLIKNMDNSS